MNNIGVYRARAQMSQQDLANRCGVSQQMVSGWEKGTRPVNNLYINIMLNLFGCTYEQLMGLQHKEVKA